MSLYQLPVTIEMRQKFDTGLDMKMWMTFLCGDE